jgi:hypothetical protein
MTEISKLVDSLVPLLGVLVAMKEGWFKTLYTAFRWRAGSRAG